MSPTPDTELPIPFGIRADTGRPLNGLTDEAVEAMLGKEREPTPEAIALAGRADASGAAFAVEGGIDANDLSQAGWGVIFGSHIDQKIKDALQPLLDHRKSQAEPFKIFDGPDGYLKGDTANEWLKRRNV